MAYGSELFLGFAHPEMVEVAERLGLTIKLKIEEEDDDFLMQTDVVKALNKKLERAWADALRNGFGHKLQRAHIAYRPGYSREEWVVAKAAGDWQEVRPWGLGLIYDPDEMGDDESQAVFGVNLIARYRPTFLDLDHPYGGSGCMVCLDDMMFKKIEVARTAVMTVLPPWKDAKIIFKTIHY